MKKIISMFLSVCFFVLISNVNVFAMTNNNTKTIDNVTNYEAITDVDELIQLGLEQYRNNPTKTLSEDDYTLEVNQLVKEVDYSDGTSDKQYKQDSIVVSDKDGNPIDVDTLADFPKEFWDSRNNSGVTVNLSLYITQRIEENFPNYVKYRLDRTVMSISKSSGVWAVSGRFGYDYRIGVTSDAKNVSPLQSLSQQSFTLNGNGQFYQGIPGEIQNDIGFKGFAYVYLSNGANISFEVVAEIE